MYFSALSTEGFLFQKKLYYITIIIMILEPVARNYSSRQVDETLKSNCKMQVVLSDNMIW